MPYENYSDIIAEVVKTIGRRNLRPSIPGWIELAESSAVHTIRSLRETILIDDTSTFTEDSAEVTLPEGITSVIALELTTDPVRQVKSLSVKELIDKRTALSNQAAAEPRYFAWTGVRTIELVPIPDSALPYTLYYTGKMTAVTAAKYKSQMLIDKPEILIYGACMHAMIYTRNSEMEASFTGRFDRAVREYGKFLARAAPTVQVAAYGRPYDRPQTTGGF